jgi:death-on-curing protein
VPPEVVLALHAELAAAHGGEVGVRDLGLLDSALHRPQHQAAYENPDAAQLAAAYAFGIVRNHPFVDGNKRIGFVVAVTFLVLNDYLFSAPEADVVTTILRLASGELPEAELADWFRSHSKARSH